LVAESLVTRIDTLVAVDPELIGLALRSTLPESERVDDFQDIVEWRRLTCETVLETVRGGSKVVVPMTVVSSRYFDETVGALRRDGVTVAHFTLMAPPAVVHDRLRIRDGEANGWARERVETGIAALADERFAIHVGAADRTPEELAAAIAGVVAPQ
jgi:hypothetical protein